MEDLVFAIVGVAIYTNPTNPEQALEEFDRFSDDDKEQVLYWYSQRARVMGATEVQTT